MVQKVFIFAPNKTDAYTVGTSGIKAIQVNEPMKKIVIEYERSKKVYVGMPFIYDDAAPLPNSQNL